MRATFVKNLLVYLRKNGNWCVVDVIIVTVRL